MSSILQKNWYQETAGNAPVFPVFQGSARCDAVVVGGGYTGLSTALTLAQQGVDTILLEAKNIGHGASGRNGGHVVTGFNPDPHWMIKKLGEEATKRLWYLNEFGKYLLKNRIEEHSISCDLRWGYIFAALKNPHMQELADMSQSWRDIFGYKNTELLDKKAIKEVVRSPKYIGGLYDGGSGALQPLSYAYGLARAAKQAGVRIFTQSALESFSDSDPLIIKTPDGEITTKKLFLAGNAYLPDSASQNIDYMEEKILPVYSYMLATQPLSPSQIDSCLPGRYAVADINFVLNYFRLSQDNRLLFGGLARYAQPGNPDTLCKTLTKKLQEIFPSLPSSCVTHFWGGRIAITRNRLPHLGALGPNILFAQGFSGHGVILSGLAGHIMAQIALQKTGQAQSDFQLFANIPHKSFPGSFLGKIIGRKWLRAPVYAGGMMWYRLRDALSF